MILTGTGRRSRKQCESATDVESTSTEHILSSRSCSSRKKGLLKEASVGTYGRSHSHVLKHSVLIGLARAPF